MKTTMLEWMVVASESKMDLPVVLVVEEAESEVERQSEEAEWLEFD